MQALTLCFSRETVTIMENLGLCEAQRGNAGDIVKAMGVYVTGQLNESVERRTFRRHTQQPGESFDDFLVSLRELAKTCNPCNFCNDGCAQKNIRDQIIEGLTNGDIVEDLLQAVTSGQQQESACLQDLRTHTTDDHAYQQLLHYVQEGFPASRGQLPDDCKPFWESIASFPWMMG